MSDFEFAQLWMIPAISKIGVAEIAGSENNAMIEAFHAVTRKGAAPDEVPWCASFACWALGEGGLLHPRSKWSLDFLNYGLPVVDPATLMYGDIVITYRGLDKNQGHVAFLKSWTEKTVNLLGGNQANRVCVKPFAREMIRAVRRPDKKLLLLN